MRWVYLLLCIAGTLVPLSALWPWLLNHGLDVSGFFGAITRSRIASFAWLDVVISAVVLFVFMAVEGKRLQMQKLWVPVAATCTVGVSLGLPLFLFMREFALGKNSENDTTSSA